MRIALVRLTLELRTPLRIGSGATDPMLDAPVVRDAFGDYRIPGSSLAGAVRAFADEAGFADCFGQGGSESEASAVEFSDGFLVDWDGETTLAKRLRGHGVLMPPILEVQERVRIDHASGTAATGGKFDAEIVPQGLRFRIEIRCVDRDDRSSDLHGPAAVLGRIVAALDTGRIRLGAGVTGGLGEVCPVEGTVSHEFHDLATPAGLAAYRRMPPSIDARLTMAGGPAGEISAAPRGDAGTIDGRLSVRFLVDGPILVGGSQRPRSAGGVASADLVFGHTQLADYDRREFVSRPWIPGSSLKGVLRHRVLHILESRGHESPERCVDDWFGSIGEQGASSSRITVRGQVLGDERPTIVQHVAIDRLTGGSLEGALYAEAPIWRDGLTFEVAIEARALPRAGAAALTHALLDMGTGGLPIGGGVNRGNGRLLFAPEAERSQGLHGRAISFDIHHDGERYRHTDADDRLRSLLGLLDGAAADGRPSGVRS